MDCRFSCRRRLSKAFSSVRQKTSKWPSSSAVTEDEQELLESCQRVPCLTSKQDELLFVEPGDIKLDKSFATCSDGIGTLYIGQFQRKSYVSVKVFDLDQYKDISSFIDEVLLMRQFSHLNLLQCFGSFVRGSELMVVLPLVIYGSVKDLLNMHYQFGVSESMAVAMVWDVLSALEYMHKRGYIHRGIKASHLLISGNGRVVLTGLGDAFNCVKGGEMRLKAYDLPRLARFSIPWLSPEVLEQNLRGYCKKSDIYSVGALACEIANGVQPYAEMSNTELLLMKVRGSYLPTLFDSTTVGGLHLDSEIVDTALPADSGVFESLPGNSTCQGRYQSASKRTFSSEFHEFVYLCVQKEANLRPSACELRRHSLFSVNRRFLNCLKEALASVQPIVNLPNESDTSSLDSTPLHLEDSETASFEWDF